MALVQNDEEKSYIKGISTIRKIISFDLRSLAAPQIHTVLTAPRNKPKI